MAQVRETAREPRHLVGVHVLRRVVEHREGVVDEGVLQAHVQHARPDEDSGHDREGVEVAIHVERQDAGLCAHVVHSLVGYAVIADWSALFRGKVHAGRSFGSWLEACH